jgi:glycosyltransferase involved in cell wall biosynthesis
MKIAIATALLESEPRLSFKWAYLSHLLPVLKAAGHEVLLLSTHWGEQQKDTLELDWDLDSVECKSFPVSRDFEIFRFRDESKEGEAPAVNRISERLALDARGYTEKLLTFIQQRIRTIDICMFISVADPFSLLGPLAIKEKSLIIPLLHGDTPIKHPYLLRALKFVGRVGCVNHGELRYFKEILEPDSLKKIFLLGLPGPALLAGNSERLSASQGRPLFFDTSDQARPPLNLDLLRTFAAGTAVECHVSDRFAAEDIGASFGGWIKPLEDDDIAPVDTYQDAQIRGRNALAYFNWLSDTANFCARLEQNWTTNHHHPFERFRGQRVVIAYRYVGENDAVGYDVIQQCEAFAELGIEARIYCQGCDENIEDMRASRSYLDSVLQDPQGALIYHLAINWPEFEDLIITARCYRYAKYHNITPKEFFLPYSKELTRDCNQARETLRLLVESRQFEGYWADSEYNRQELIQYGVLPHVCSVMPPYNKALSLTFTGLSPEALKIVNKDSLKVLCVGRIAPNKGHRDLVLAIAEYVRIFDDKIELYIVGALDPRLSEYLEEIRRDMDKYGVNNKVRICGRLSHSEIATLYHACDVLLMLSYHEGFCVPIIEAQENLLPVIAYRTSALIETVEDKTALCEVGDFYSIAVKLNNIRNSMSKVKLA